MLVRGRRRVWGILAMAVLPLVGACGAGTDQTPGNSNPAQSPAAVSISPGDAQQPISPITPVAVTATAGTLSSVTVKNAATGAVVKGALSADKKHWQSSEPLGYGAHYQVVAEAANGAGQTIKKESTLATITPAKQAYANLIPAPDVVRDGGVGVGQPLVFQFTAPVTDKSEVQKRLQVTTDPPQEGAWYWMDDKNVHYRPKEYWKPGTTIHVAAHVYGLDLGRGTYGAEDNETTYKVHDSWVAKADGKSEQLQIFQNGQQVKTMPMSLGSPGFPTHLGPHVISEKQPSITMDSCSYGVCPGQPGYYREKVDLDLRISNDGEFVHSAPWSVGQQGNSNVSHGCVNLAPPDAQWFFDHFGMGDVVEVTNSGGPPLPVWDTYGDWTVPWEQWQAGVGQHR